MHQRTESDFERVRVLCRKALSHYEIARQSGVPRSTVQRWRAVPAAAARRPDPHWRPPVASTYCYLLGVYLGDGWLVQRGRSAKICCSMDPSYPRIIEETVDALEQSFPGRVAHCQARDGCTILQMSHPSLPFAFPQHGPGRKHERSIELAEWQEELTHAFPRQLIRGLIHSDGCRCVNRFDTHLPGGRVAHYEYPRYFFTNLSGDIRRIFCDHCDLLGIRWTRSSPRNISVSQRKSVGALDGFVGRKR